MVDDTDAAELAQFREDFRQVVEAYNAAIRAGKVRAIRAAAATAHQEIFALSQKVRTSHPDQIDLISQIEKAFMDVRWGRAILEGAGELR